MPLLAGVGVQDSGEKPKLEPLTREPVALRHPGIQILPPCGMMSLKDLKEHHYTK
jgi:hypothetical protein